MYKRQQTLCALGYAKISAACICGAEVVNPKIPSLLDAQALAGMTERWAPYNMEVYGPVGLDLAVSKEACRHKHYDVPGAGEADILLVPDYEVGNAMGKADVYKRQPRDPDQRPHHRRRQGLI